ncbi:hypothetical protein Tco_1506214 [Tanacetum coccineum]
MSSSSSTSNWIRLIPTHCFCDLPESGSQCRFYHFLDPEIRYGYYRNEMHNLYIQLQQARREIQVQEYTYRTRIHDLKSQLNERTVTGDCYKKAIVVFIIMVFVMNVMNVTYVMVLSNEGPLGSSFFLLRFAILSDGPLHPPAPLFNSSHFCLLREPLSASFFSDSLLLIHSYQQVAAISASVISAPIICQMLDPAAHLDLLNLGSTKLDLHALGSADATRINKA